MRQIYICCGSNNLKPIVMLTLVYTRIHVALPHDYICVALNKMTHLTLSNNSALIVAGECEIVFRRQLVHCQAVIQTGPTNVCLMNYSAITHI